jgi:hypothetical protein
MLRVFPGQESRLELYLDGPTGAAGVPAVVQVLEPDGSGSPGTLVLVTGGDDLRRAGSAVTDEGGLARVDLTERGTLLVRALRAGRSGGPVPLATSGPTVVTLRAPAQLRGHVIAPEGRPVAGFKLQLVALGDDVSVASSIGGPAGLKNARGTLHREFTGERFDLADAPAGPVGVSVQTPSGRSGHAQLELAPGESREVDILLEPGASVEGRAVDARSGTPVAGAAVIVLDGLGSPPRSEVTTEVDGRFRVAGLAMGLRRLRVVAAGYAPVERDAELGSGGGVDVGEIALPAGTVAATR